LARLGLRKLVVDLGLGSFERGVYLGITLLDGGEIRRPQFLGTFRVVGASLVNCGDRGLDFGLESSVGRRAGGIPLCLSRCEGLVPLHALRFHRAA